MTVSLDKGRDVTLKGRAACIGAEHGRSAATWMFDGNTDRSTYERYRRWMDDGDPELWDYMPHQGMSGEFVDDYTHRELARDCCVVLDDEFLWELCDAYRDAFYEAAYAEVERAVEIVLAA